MLLLGTLLLVAACARPIPAPVTYGTKNGGKQPSVDQTASKFLAAGDYTVAADETLYAIARRSGVALRDLIAANGLAPPYRLRRGRQLRIPDVRYHQVAAGETLYSISRRYQVSPYVLARNNQVPSPYTIHPDQRLRLPASDSPTGAQRGTDSETTLNISPETKSAAVPAPRRKPEVRRPVTTRPPARADGRFAWPVKGQVISRFGVKPNGLHNDGINIAVKKGTVVRAADNGVVVYAGNELRGFGNLLLLRHRDGWLTAYGHNQAIEVKVGDVVRRGQKIARSGNTGNITRPQLHFEIRQGREAVDPAQHLSKSKTAAMDADASGWTRS
ncbi:MAG: M23 family metallopeptidase [Proteobacteria bacterium]|nr:M23 family metallopeptidase [Pseudomonadota bacterium]